MRTNGRTSSCGGGASMTTTVLSPRVRRKYLRNEASPARRLSRASPQPARVTKSARKALRSDIELRPTALAVDFERDAEVLGHQRAQPPHPFDPHDALGH